jgi:hypothetical protein
MPRLVLAVCLALSSAALADDDKPNCRALEESGALIAEAHASSAMDCSRKMQDEVRAARCQGKKSESYKYKIEAPKTNRQTPQSVRCK